MNHIVGKLRNLGILLIYVSSLNTTHSVFQVYHKFPQSSYCLLSNLELLNLVITDILNWISFCCGVYPVHLGGIWQCPWFYPLDVCCACALVRVHTHTITVNNVSKNCLRAKQFWCRTIILEQGNLISWWNY